MHTLAKRSGLLAVAGAGRRCVHLFALIVTLPLLVMLTGCVSPTAPTIEADYLFENVNVVPMTSETILPVKAVAVKDGRILGILGAGEAKMVQATHRIDGQGRYMLPGLADMHVHTRADPETTFKLQLANGVTTVRNLSDRDGGLDHPRIRADVAAGTLLGPRYLISGPFLDDKSLKSVADVAPLLDRHVEVGYDYVKIHGDLPDDIYLAVIDGAKRRNLLVTGHVQRHRPLHHSLGMYSIEHAEEFLHAPGRAALADPVMTAEAAKAIEKSGVFVLPTLVIFDVIGKYMDDAKFARLQSDPLVAYLPPAIQTAWLTNENNMYRRRFAQGKASLDGLLRDAQSMSRFVKALHEAGVPLVLGSDAFGALVPGFAVHQELRLLVDAGLTPYEALRTGTVNVAKYLRESDTAGSIEPGKRADFILLEGNPLQDIANAAQVRGVFINGRWISETELKSMLASVPAAFANPSNKYAR